MAEVVYEGWMVRCGRRKIGWSSFIHMRYFVLERRLLAYYKRKPQDNVVPIKTLLIDENCRVEDRGLQLHNDHMIYVLCVYNKRKKYDQMIISGFNIQETLIWKEKIEQVIDQHQNSTIYFSNKGHASVDSDIQRWDIRHMFPENDETDSDGGSNQEVEAEMDSPLPYLTPTSSPTGGYEMQKFKFSSLLAWGLPKLRLTSSTAENYKLPVRERLVYWVHLLIELLFFSAFKRINKRKEPTKWDGITTFTYSALMQATSNFNKSNELGKGGFGRVYKGDLLCTKVAIKILHREGDASQEQAFRREVDTLCRVNHPHLVQLIGVCPEKSALVYEFMEGGTLEDRLVRKDLSWQDRIRIATEICSAIVFLHSRRPDIVVHGDLKPANILLDASGMSKLGDFGICRVISPSSTSTTTHITASSLQGSGGYMDPLSNKTSSYNQV